ncbi:MAG TPA: hypothetical protein VEW26_02010, partial [Allosphingosinicella sp.]|nr:hypothetical protein [Allosphingosinicella sp.]
ILGSIFSSEAVSNIIVGSTSILALLVLFQLANADPGATPAEVLNGNDIGKKIDYLLTWRERTPQGMRPLMYATVLAMGALVLWTTIRNNKDKLATRIFCWGREAQRYAKYKGLKEKILWGVVIALAVGVTGGLMTGAIQRFLSGL